MRHLCVPVFPDPDDLYLSQLRALRNVANLSLGNK